MDDLVSEQEKCWLKEGLSYARKNVDYPYRCVYLTSAVFSDSKIPHVKNETGKDITPKPLFPVFLRGAIAVKEDQDTVEKKPTLEKGDGTDVRRSTSAIDDMSDDVVAFEEEDAPDTQKEISAADDEEKRLAELEKIWSGKSSAGKTWKQVLALLLGRDVTQGEEPLEDETAVDAGKESLSKEVVTQETGETSFSELIESIDPEDLPRTLSESDPFFSLFIIEAEKKAATEKKKLQEEQLKNLEEYFLEWDKAIEDLKREKTLKIEDQPAKEKLPVHKKEKEEILLKDSDVDLQKDIIDLMAPSLSIEFFRNTIFLKESDTFFLLDIPNAVVLPDSIEYHKVSERNNFYEEALNKYAVNDILHEIGTQVHQPLKKNVSVGTGPLPELRENHGMIDEFLYYQTYFEENVEDEGDEETLVRKVEINDMDGFIKYLEQNQDEFLPILHYFEKAMNKNSYSELLSACIKPTSKVKRVEVPVEQKPGNYNAPYLKQLLTVSSDLTAGHPVTCVCFNYVYPYYFAAGFNTSSELIKHVDVLKEPGCIICWDIRHFQVPEIVFYTPEVVTCLEFSKTSPYLLAAGMRLGLLAIFDISKKGDKPQVDNYCSPDRPYGDIGRLHWSVPKEKIGIQDRTIITCISVDGILYQWSPGTGARGIVVKSADRATAEATMKKKEYIDLSYTVNVPYLCLDLSPSDTEICVVGCLTGEILQCDVFGSVICSHKKHHGPVYETRWSPIVKDVFISCGFDSSICLWDAGKSNPSRVFLVRGREPVIHVDWSNTSSTLFGAVTYTKIKIYDMSLNRVSELIERQQQKPNEKFTCISFFPYGNWFFVGRTDGSIEVFDIINVPEFHDDPEAALKSAFLT